MPGFDNQVINGSNVDFTGDFPIEGQIVADGQLLIGSAVEPFINAGFLESSNASITFINGPGTIDLSFNPSGSPTVLTKFSADTGIAIPVLNNIGLIGGSGVTTSASGNTVTITSSATSISFSDITASTLAVNNGYFATAAGNYGLPATAAQGDIIVVISDTSGAVVLDSPALNFIRIGNAVTSSGGTITSTAIGDAIILRYRLSTLTWYASSSMGNWTIS